MRKYHVYLRLRRRVSYQPGTVSNVDDHLRNHGFLWTGKAGWILSPAYDLNPVPAEIKARVLTTNIDLDEGTCSLDLVRSAAGEIDRMASAFEQSDIDQALKL